MRASPENPGAAVCSAKNRPDERRAKTATGPKKAAYGVMEPGAAHESNAHEELRRKLASRYGARGEYVGAATVARILGMGLTTIYEQSKDGRFVIPHRLANRKPLFLLDDLVAWMLGGSGAPASNAATMALPEADAGQTAPPTARHVFRHAEAEEAFLRTCAERGIKLPRSR